MNQLLQYDFYVLDFIREHLSSPLLDALMIVATKSADLGLIWIIPAVFCLFFKKTRTMGISVLFALTISIILSDGILKPIFGRLRPFEHIKDFSLLITAPHGSSFPSSHTVTSFAAAAAFFVANKKLGVPALILAGIVAFSRIYLYVHFLSDILVGTLIGITIGLLSTSIIRKFYRK